jgi:hypothetical protein
MSIGFPAPEAQLVPAPSNIIRAILGSSGESSRLIQVFRIDPELRQGDPLRSAVEPRDARRGYPAAGRERRRARMTARYPQDHEPLIPYARPDPRRPAPGGAVVVPSRLPLFFQEIQDALSQAGDEDSFFPIRHFLPALGRDRRHRAAPSLAARLHAAEHALTAPDANVRDQAVREAAEIVRAAYREIAVTGTGNSAPMTCPPS